MDIDFSQIEKMAEILCSKEEIVYITGKAEFVLNELIQKKYNITFDQWYLKFSSKGKEALRKKQFDLATEGDSKMLIWLGKQYLDQKDRRETDAIINMPEISYESLISEVQANKTSG